MKLDDLVNEFATNVHKQTQAIETLDYKSGNRHAKKYISIYKKIILLEGDGRAALCRLLDDPRADVRVMAAAYLLDYCEERAKAILLAEATGQGIVAFGAEQALMRWEEGSWDLDKC